MRFRVAYLLPPALLPILAAATTLQSGCATAPAQEALRTFERAERLTTVCVRVAKIEDGYRQLVDPVAVPDAECPKVPGAIDPDAALAHVVGFVTQTTRGELAAVDLSSATILDVDRTTPGVDPIVAPALPTDVAASSDSSTIFVAGGTPSGYALYGAPTVALLGQGFRVGATPPPSLLAYRACALPSRPTRLFAIPADYTHPNAAPGKIAVVLGGTRLDAARLLIVDAAPFGANGSLVPGDVGACPIVGSVELSGAAGAVGTGASWGDGLGFDAGAGTTIPLPPGPAGCAQSTDAGAGDAGADSGTDAGADAGEDAGVSDGGATDAGPSDPNETPRIGDGARADNYLYLADSARPLVHVIDLSDPSAPREIAPYVLTSTLDATRVGGSSAVAVSPPTRDFKRFLYAIDTVDGSVAVFDATDPKTASRSPLLRPHPEANPFQAPDRLTFGAKAAQVAFARHDFPLLRDARGNALATPKTGLLCNPNPGATDDGVAYAANGNYTSTLLGPSRLRGVFGFVTLTNGEVTVIDVDDWDAPCRRPADLSGDVPVSAATPTMPVGPSSDPYGAPLATVGATTDEAYYPVSAPHRPRASYYLREDTDQGRRIPAIAAPPSLALVDAPLPTQGPEALKYPTLLPTRTALRDFTLVDPKASNDASLTTPGDANAVPNVRLSWEAPDLQVDQTWTVSYEGALPGFDGLSGGLSSNDGEKTLILTQPDALFCRRGVEDAFAGRERATRLQPALAATGENVSRDPSQVLADYVQITNEVLPVTDPWWTDAVLPDSCEAVLPGNANQRQSLCTSTFGLESDEVLERDFPILEAHDDRLVLGRFGYTDRAKGISARQVVSADSSNADLLRRARCCFQDRVSFRVRAGGSFVAVGSSSGYLHHVSRDPSGACVLSCTERERLLESRVFPSPRPSNPANFRAADRNDPLAFRNPFFSFVVYEASPAAMNGQSTTPGRDMKFQFATRGGYSSLIYNLAAQSSAVAPRSLQYIDALGELAVVDGSAQGLVLIDLATLTLARPTVN